MKENLKITVLGAGESGNGAALLAQRENCVVFVSDFGSIKEPYKQELIDHEIPFEESGHSVDKILESDLIIKSPGIPEEAPIIQTLRKAGNEIISEIEWGYRFKKDAKIIAITGTNGKSTTTKLIWHILKTSGEDVLIGGNYGISFARQLATRPLPKWFVLEISSFQLDDIKTFRPDISVLLNITPDHLNRYQHQFSNYVAAKFKIAAHQQPEDLFIINGDDPVISEYLKLHQLKPRIATFTMKQDQRKKALNNAFVKKDTIEVNWDGEKTEISIHDLTIKGQHNLYNSMAAGISARAAGIRKEKFQECFSSFTGLEHRLEYVATVRGIDFINDSKGTNLNSVWFALESMEVPVVLILGGLDKGNNYDEIMDLVKEKVHAIVCLGVDNRPILAAFSGIIPHVVETRSAKDAVHAAYTLADKGDAVLLSPGCASFDLFKNFEDRGNQFKEAVLNL